MDRTVPTDCLGIHTYLEKIQRPARRKIDTTRWGEKYEGVLTEEGGLGLQLY